MKPSVFSVCIIKLDEFFNSEKWSPEDDINSFLKLLEYATMIDSEDDEELPQVVLKGMKELPKRFWEYIVSFRNSEPFVNLSFTQERFVYRTLRKIYAQ